jgi:upstream activation factor subunit UAF30
MPRKTKETKTTTAPAAKPAAKKATKTAIPAKTATKAKETTATNEVVETVAEQTADQVVGGEFTKVLAQIQAVYSQISALKSAVRDLEKKAVREIKTANKKSKRSASKGNRTPSGFVKPAPISAELAAFLGKAKGTEMARTDVTKEINAYIRANSLQDKDNGRIIVPDAKLTKLLNLKKEDQLTYFNLQRYMSPHFSKSKPATAVSTSA